MADGASGQYGTVVAALDAADQRRQGGADERASAMRTYAELASSIDPATPEGEARVAWIVDGGAFVADELEDLLRRASQTAGTHELRRACSVFLFQFPLRRGDYRGAEELLRTLLRELRNSRCLAEIGTCNNLARVFQAQNREFETVVLARRAARLSIRMAAPFSLGVALSRLCWALRRLGDWDELERAADQLGRLVGSLDAHHHPFARRASLHARAEVHFARGEHVAARRCMQEALDEHVPRVAGASSSPDALDAKLLEVRIAIAEQRHVEAAALARDADVQSAGDEGRALMASAQRVRALAAAGRRVEAGEEAATLQERLRAPAARALGPSTVLDAAALVGAALQPQPGAVPFYAIAAQAALERIAELHACVAGLEELSAAIHEDRARLARYRMHFAREHRTMLDAFARLHDDPAAEPPVVLSELAAAGHMRVCAWCLTLSMPDGRELPIGHLVPDSTRLGVTHGICNACRDRVDG